MWAPIDMKPACPKESCPTVMGRNMLSPMIMLIAIVMRSASPSEKRPVTMVRGRAISSRMAPVLPSRLDLQAAAEEPRRPVEEDQDEDPEGEAVLPGGNEVRHAH